MASIKIFRCNDQLYETSANGEGNITSVASAIRTVQKESNEFLSKLVEQEKLSNNNTGSKTGAGDGVEDDEDDDDDSEEEKMDQSDSKETEGVKRRTSQKSPPNAKKKCSK